MDWNTQTNWLYGEVGSRLDSNRSNEYFQYSAKELNNLYITQTGTLRVMKQWEPEPLGQAGQTVAGDVVAVLETRYPFYVLITTQGVYTKRTSDNHELGKITGQSIAQGSNCAVFFKNKIGIVHGGSIKFFQFDEGTGANVKVFDFQKDYKPPLKDRQPVQFDVHKIYERSFIEKTDPTTGVVTIKKEKSIERIASQVLDPNIKLTADGHILLANQGGKVARIYGEPILSFREEDLTLANVQYGDLIINFPKGVPTNLLFDTEKITWDAQQTDKTKNFVTKVTNTKLWNKEGDLFRGDVIDLLGNCTSITVFQNRLVLTDEDTIYFSKVNDFHDFTNYVKEDSPFYVKPNPIINEQPLIVNSYSSRGLYIATNKGIYVMGYNVQLTPATATVETVSDTPSTNKVAMIDSNFFFIGTDDHLYSIQEDTELSRSRLFKYVVEKYDLNFKVRDITTVRFDKFKRLVVVATDKRTFLYDVILGVDTFRRTSFDFTITGDSRIFGINEDLITNTEYHRWGTKNYPQASIKVHQPNSMLTQSGGTLANDDNTMVDGAQIAIINEHGDSIKLVSIDGVECSNLGYQVNMMSLYFVKNVHRAIEEGFYYTVDTYEGDGVVEITALEYYYKPSGTY